MKLIYKLSIILSLTSCLTHGVDTIISMFLLKYPYFKTVEETKKFETEQTSQILHQPDYVYKKPKKHHWGRGVPGISCLYTGYDSLSDKNGQIQFPKLQQNQKDPNPEIYLLISKGVGFNPDFIIAPSTIHNWGLKKQDPLTLDTDQDYAIYSITQKEDKALNLSYFDVQPATFPNIEDKNKPEWREGRYVIPLNTIILHSDPKHIFVPIGATVVDKSPNLFLPPIYIKKEFCFVFNSLATLAIKQYFAQEVQNFQLENQTISHIQQRRY